MIGHRFLLNSPAASRLLASSKPSWRSPGGSPRRPVGRNAGGPNWLERRPGPDWESKAVRIAGLILLALIIPALLIGWRWTFPDRPTTPMLVLAVTDYDAPVPPNALAAEDVVRFQQADKDYDNLTMTVADPGRTSQDFLASIESFLKTASPGGPGDNVILIYLSVHGVVDDRGAPCLVFPADNPLDATTWLPVAKVFELIEGIERLKDCHKIVLLDACRIDDAWRMGVVVNTFAAALEARLTAAPPANCTVICAASGLQTAVAGPEIGGTPFGYFAARALRGEADVEGRADKIVTLGELEQYLVKHVDDWVVRYRGVRQTPVLLGNKALDLKLAYATGAEPIPEQSWHSPIDRETFAALFRRVAQLEQDRVFELDPLDWAKVQTLLERLDLEAFAGNAYEGRARDVTLTELNSTLRELESMRRFDDVTPHSLAMRDRLNGAPDASLETTWQKWLEAPDKPLAQRPTYDAAAKFTWSLLTGGDVPVTAEQLEQVLAFCQLSGQTPRQELEFREMALLRLLAKHVDWGSPALPHDALPRLLVARGVAETLAAPADPRQHYVLQWRQRPLDDRLAVAFDRVLVGDDESLHAAGQDLATLLGTGPDSYRQAEGLSQLVLRAQQARDAALSASLHFSSWLVRRARFDVEFRSRPDLTLAALIRDVTDLSACLDDVLSASSQEDRRLDEGRLRTLTAAVEAGTKRWYDAYATRVVEITNEKRGSRATTAIETSQLLRCPLGWGESRTLLHEQWLADWNGKAGAVPTMPDTSAASADGAELEYLRWLASEGVGALRELDYAALDNGSDEPGRSGISTIDGDSTLHDAVVALARVGGRLRGRLRGIADECEQLRGQTTDRLARRPAREARRGLSQADVLSRSWAPLASSELRFGAGLAPASQLRVLDEQAWLAWQGRRVLDDCWGTWNEPFAGIKPYFQTTATRIADEAEQLAHDARFDVSELRTRTEKLSRLIAAWRPVSSEDLLVADDGGRFMSHSLSFQAPQPVGDLRPGEVSVFLADEGGKLFETYNPATSAGVRRVGVDVLKSATLENRLTPDKLSDVPVLYAHALFRGHVKDDVFSIGRGVIVQWTQSDPKPASVLVRGDSKQVSQIYFIVDCSHSMGQFGRNRLKEGRQVLRTILADLMNRSEQFRIGLIVYGRRAGWEDVGGRWQPKFLRGGNYNGAPGRDVEHVFSPRPLNKQLAADIDAFMERAEPLGETPLYLALTFALENFDEETSGPRHILAITDGVNDVLLDDPQFPIPNPTKSQDVMQALDDHPTRIDVIEFGVDVAKLSDREKQFWPARREEVRSIAESANSGGSFRLAQNTADLEAELLNSLRLDRFAVVAAPQAPVESVAWHELGTVAALPAPQPRDTYTIHLQTHDAPPANIEVEGGEALEVVYQAPPTNHLVYPIYVDQGPYWSPVPNDSKPREFLVAAHEPIYRLQGPATFRVSVQSGNRSSAQSGFEERFSRRPEVIWAMVESRDGATPHRYYFVDREFQAGLPVPMILLRANEWSGRFARVEFSFAMDADSLRPKTFLIPKLGSDSFEAGGATFRIKSEMGAQGYQVVVDEQHLVGSENYPLHVQLVPAPDSIRRTFFDGNRSVHHVFHYNAQQETPPELRVLTRREIEAGGMSVQFDRIELPRR